MKLNKGMADGGSQNLWPTELPNPDPELVSLIEAAMIDFGPDGHCDGADEIAAIVTSWFESKVSGPNKDAPPPPPDWYGLKEV